MTEIADGAFHTCEKLKSITITASVTAIEESVFRNCRNLTAIHVQPGNPNYFAVGL